MKKFTPEKIIIYLKNNFLLKSVAACHNTKSDLVMYFTVNSAFVNYFDDLIDSLDVPFLQNWTAHQKILPISLQSFEFNQDLLQVPKILKDFLHQNWHKKEIFDLQIRHIDNNLDSNINSVFNNYTVEVFLFVTVITSLVVTVIVMYIICRHAKLKSLVTNIALQQIRRTDAVPTNNIEYTCKMQWYTIVTLY